MKSTLELTPSTNQPQSIQSLIELASSDYPRVWTIVRTGMVESEKTMAPGLSRDVFVFCRTVFETFEPAISEQERLVRRNRAGSMAASLNVAIPEAFRALQSNDFAFYEKWCNVSRWLTATGDALHDFSQESLVLTNQDLVFSVLFYGLYTSLFFLAYQTFPAGLLWPTSLAFGIAHALR